MDWFKHLVVEEGVEHTIFIVCAVIFLGILIGKIRFFTISFGIAGVLFSGLFLGHFTKYGLDLNLTTLKFIQEFGLILFVYTIGVQIGPAFFASFKKQGIKLNLMAVGVVLMGVICASVIFLATDLNIAKVVGIMSGAVTNTPGLGAAQEALHQVFPKAEPEFFTLPGMGYAIAYPYGIFGIIITMLLLKKIFKIDVVSENEKFMKEQLEASSAPMDFNLTIAPGEADGMKIAQFNQKLNGGFVIVRIWKGNELTIPAADTKLEAGNHLELSCTREKFDQITAFAGEKTAPELIPEALGGKLVAVTSKEATKKTIAELNFPARYGVCIKRIERAGVDILPRPGMKLQYGDNVQAAGREESLEMVAEELGNSYKNLQHPDIMPIFIGIVLGLIIGAIPIPIPGLPKAIKLGVAGGPLLVAICLSRIRQIGPLSWYLPHSANLVLREIGITMFLACVGLKSGAGFLDTLLDGEGVYWMLMGMIITTVPLFTMAFVGKLVFKLNYLTICGLLSGSCTDPPALSFANQMAGSDAPALTYASVYAMAMFMRILCAQLLVIIFSACT